MSQKKSNYPFYVHSMDQKRSVRIIKEAKAEIKKLESNRPTTPFISKNGVTGLYKEQTSRPSSCASIRSLNYEPEENCPAFCRKLSPLKRNKDDSADVKLEPIVTKSILKSRKTSISDLKITGEAVIQGFPPLSCEHNNKSLLEVQEGIKNRVEHEKQPFRDQDHHSPELNNLEALQSQIVRLDLSPRKNENCSNLYKDKFTDSDFKELQEFFPLLKKFIRLERKLKEEEAVETVDKLYSLLEKQFNFTLPSENRTPLLKLLFKLLDSHFCVLSLNIVKLLIKMRIKDKNLCSCFRLVLRLLKDEKIDLNEYQLLESIFEVMNSITLSSNSEAVLYGIKILKTLLCYKKLKTQQSELCIDILINQLRDLNALLTKESMDSNVMEIIALIVSIFRYLIEDDLLWKYLIKVETLTEIIKVLTTYSQSTETVQVVVRLISKIMDKEEGCDALSKCPQNLLLSFLTLLETYRYHIDVTLQISFIISNLLSYDEKIAITFISSTNFIATITVIEEYVNEHLQCKGSIAERFKSHTSMSCGDKNWRHDFFQVIVKILSIWANSCLHPEAGNILARKKEIVSYLLDTIVAYSEAKSPVELYITLQSFIVVVANISYYLENDSDLSIKATECVVPLLDDSFPKEVRFEAANVIRNLTRLPDVRTFIQKHALLPAFIKLLGEDNNEFCVGAYGIILNLLIDGNSRQIFYIEQGVTRILHKLHLCTDRDWKTSALIIHMLWNYCGGESAEEIPLSDKESQHLIKYLTYSTNEDKENSFTKKDTIFYTEWKNMFCPVAIKLLVLLKTKRVCGP